MPTGYTAAIYEGKNPTFEEFALDCARAFGALILLRDSDKSEPIPQFEPSTEYDEERLAFAIPRLAEVNAWTDEEADAQAIAVFDEAVREWSQRQNERLTLRMRYMAMLDQVRAWEPPTEDHRALKNFMDAQLCESIEHDCRSSFPKAPTAQTGAEYRQAEILRLQWDIDNARKHIAEEIERTESRNAWVAALFGSLGLPAPGERADDAAQV